MNKKLKNTKLLCPGFINCRTVNYSCTHRKPHIENIDCTEDLGCPQLYNIKEKECKPFKDIRLKYELLKGEK